MCHLCFTFRPLLLGCLESGVLQLDEAGGKVRAVPEKRCVLILREIPKNTPEKVQRMSVW